MIMKNEFCPDHDCIKNKISNLAERNKFWLRIVDSKWFFWALTGLIASFFAFNTWVTTEIFAQKSDSKKMEELCADVNEVKKEVKDEGKRREEDRKTDADRRVTEQRDLMKILLDIQKQIKK